MSSFQARRILFSQSLQAALFSMRQQAQVRLQQARKPTKSNGKFLKNRLVYSLQN